MRQEFAERRLEPFKHAREDVRPLLAERVEVEAFDGRDRLSRHLRTRRAETRVRRARVVDFMFDLAVKRVDAEARRRARPPRARGEPRDLRRRVEDDVVAHPDDLPEVRFGERGVVDVVLAVRHRLRREACLEEPARRRAVQMLRDQRIGLPRRERLLGEQDPDPRSLAHAGEEAAVAHERRLVEEIEGRPQSTFTGLKFSCHGSPCFGSSAMNGSGSNSSHV